jgi:hypothetical protein
MILKPLPCHTTRAVRREHAIRLRDPGPRPAYSLIADHLWGAGCNIDSDGNSVTPDDPNWTELSLILRDAARSEQVHVDLISEHPLILEIRSPSEALCKRAAEYLARTSGGLLERAV